MTPADAPLYLLAGPTASGKSAKALAWAETTGGTILNADSMQLYRDVPILTARPSRADEARAPHALYGLLDAQTLWSAGDWLRAARPFLAEALNGGPPVCVVGGTGLYFNALIHGLAEVPEIADAAREQARGDYERQAEARILPNDRQRLTRAYEVYLQSGTSLSDWQARTRPELPQTAYVMEILNPPRDALYARCDRRLQLMLDEGALDEVRDLMARGLAPDWPILRVLGLSEFTAHLRGDMTLDAALDLARQKTRNYAKRQTTWFRNQFRSPLAETP
jgi:tRNA dimethylallyltransferase